MTRIGHAGWALRSTRHFLSIVVTFIVSCAWFNFSVVMSRYGILSSVRDRYFWHEIPRDRDWYLPKGNKIKNKKHIHYYVKWCAVPDIWLRSWHSADKMLLPKKRKNILFFLFVFFIPDFSSGWAFKSGRYRYPEPNDRDTDYRYTVTSLIQG